MDPRMVQEGGAVVIWDGAEVDHLVLEDQGRTLIHTDNDTDFLLTYCTL